MLGTFFQQRRVQPSYPTPTFLYLQTPNTLRAPPKEPSRHKTLPLRPLPPLRSGGPHPRHKDFRSQLPPKTKKPPRNRDPPHPYPPYVRQRVQKTNRSRRPHRRGDGQPPPGKAPPNTHPPLRRYIRPLRPRQRNRRLHPPPLYTPKPHQSPLQGLPLPPLQFLPPPQAIPPQRQETK